jgi:hypothetical protein
MKFPNKLTVVVQDRGTLQPVGKVAIRLGLIATKKNNYSVGPVITDLSGAAVFTRADCEFAIQRAWEMFLMDYHDTLDECQPVVEIGLYQAKQVSGMIRQYTAAPKFWGMGFRDPEALMEVLQTVRNAEYRPDSITISEAQVLAEPRVELWVSKNR